MEDHISEQQPLEAETLVWYGGAVKALDDDGRIGGYLVRFSTADDPDLAGDFFTKDTDFGPIKSSPILYHHGLDKTLKARSLGLGDLKTDDVGVWLEGQLELRDGYEKAIFEMAKSGKLGWSSGTASHLVQRKAVGKSYRIESWPLGLDASLTPTPCEPRTKAIPLKSVDLAPLEIKADSLSRMIEEVHSAFYSAYGKLEREAWVVKVFDAHIVARFDGKFFQIPYSRPEGKVAFSNSSEWTEVMERREWVEKKSLYLKHIADLKAQETDDPEASLQDAAVAVEAKSEAAEQPTAKTMNKQQQAQAPEQEAPKAPEQEARAEIKSTASTPGLLNGTSQIGISVEELVQFRMLQEQAKAFSQDPQKVVKAQHEVSSANVNLKTGLGDNEVKALAYWVRTGDMGAVSHMKSVNEENNEWSGAPRNTISIKASNDTDMNVGTAADGGTAVPTGHFQGIIARRDEAMISSTLGVRNIPGKGTTVNVPVDNEDDGEFVATAEAAANDRDAPAIAPKVMTLAKYTKRVELSDELMNDEDSNLMAFLEDFVGRGMAKTHNNLLLAEVAANGTSLKTFASNSAIADGEIDDIEGNDNLGGYLDDFGNVGWVMRNSTLSTIRKISGNDRVYAVEDGGGPGVRANRTLLGYPVLRSNQAAAIATVAKTVYFGNWFYVGVRNDPEFRVLRDPYSAATTGQLRLHYFFRTVYGVLQAEAIGYGVHPV